LHVFVVCNSSFVEQGGMSFDLSKCKDIGTHEYSLALSSSGGIYTLPCCDPRCTKMLMHINSLFGWLVLVSSERRELLASCW
jgi:hypothetical protein